MRKRHAWAAVMLSSLAGLCACGGGGGGASNGSGSRAQNTSGTGSGASGESGNAGSSDQPFDNPDTPDVPPMPMEVPTPNPEAFWAEDPPPMSCLEDGTMAPPPNPPGGTPECPDDKNREGCPCEHVDEIRPCWPGLRANRNRGICSEGKTTCREFGEFAGSWGPCEGYRLPLEGATAGPDACNCFSAGRWEIDNLSPCFISYTTQPAGTQEVWAVSTFIGLDGMSACPADPGGPPPQPEPASDWSTSRLTVDCSGRFELCYTLKAGDAANPQPTDCTLTRQCVETWYETAGETQELPPLGAWSGSDAACAQAFQDVGGYGEMTVKGLSVECDPVDDGAGNELVFNRVPYCSAMCSMMPDLPECQTCSMGGSGDF